MEKLKKLKILYVDDDTAIRQNAVEYLELYCDNVFEAKDGKEALNQYEKIEPDIIITDIKMPEMNGLDMVREIRKKDNYTKIIIATAFLENHYLLEAVELRLIKYLVKPVKQKELLDVLCSCVDDVNNQSNIIDIDSHHKFDMFNKILLRDGNIIELAKKELKTLFLLLKNCSRVVSYDEFDAYVWHGEMTIDALRTVMRELRAKISKEQIKNVSGMGYKIQILS